MGNSGIVEAGVTLDADQVRAQARLAELIDHRGRPVKRHRGIYLHGRPGRGKTMLMDRFYRSIDSDRKRRFHFHQFFAQLHSAVHEFGSIDTAIDKLLGNARLMCFDEFHVHDIGDAMLITRMLEALFARPITLVLTSNYPPALLLPNPLFHDHFVPTIERITAQLDIVTVDGPLDYRALGPNAGSDRTGFAAGRYLVETGQQPAVDRIDVPIGTRRVRALAVEGAALTIDFADLCGTATAAADYVDLARRFRSWTICAVPRLRDVPPDWVMRFVNVVDVLYDAAAELVVSAEVPLAELVAEVGGIPDLDRIASRLCELTQAASATPG